MQTPEKKKKQPGIQIRSAAQLTTSEKGKIKQTEGGGCNYSREKKPRVSPLAWHNKKVCQAPVQPTHVHIRQHFHDKS